MTVKPPMSGPTAWMRLIVQAIALLVSLGGATASLKSDIGNIQTDIAGLRQQVNDTQADVTELRHQVENVTGSLLGTRR